MATVNAFSWSLYPLETSPVPIEYEAGLAPEPVWALCRREKSLAPCPDSNAGSFSPCRDAIPTELSPLLGTVFIEVQIVIGLHHRHHHHHHHHHKLVGLCRKYVLLFIPWWSHRRLFGLPQPPRLIGQLRNASFVSLSQGFAMRFSRNVMVLQNFARSGGTHTHFKI